jgi:predicted alpha/beta superfamily hydrolase
MQTLPLLMTTLTLIAKVPYTTESTGKIYVTGNTNELCQWKADCIQMSSLGNGIFQTQIQFPKDASGVQYKITRGTLSSDSTNGTQTLKSTPASPTVLQLFQWSDRKPTGAPTTLEVIPNFYSPELQNSRALRILLPENYAAHPEKSYPVIYMHDGQNIFDSATANYKIEWNVDETLYSLVRKGKVREAIVVAPDANQDRLNEYDFTIKGQHYASFLLNTVKPFVDSHYRTLKDREHTYLSGSSMGAHISLALLWHHPEVFSKMAGLSFPADIHGQSIYKIITPSTRPSLPIDIYLDHGDYGQDASYPKPADDFMNYLLKTLNFKPRALQYLNFPFAEHFESDWARRFAIPLQFLLSGN